MSQKYSQDKRPLKESLESATFCHSKKVQRFYLSLQQGCELDGFVCLTFEQGCCIDDLCLIFEFVLVLQMKAFKTFKTAF